MANRDKTTRADARAPNVPMPSTAAMSIFVLSDQRIRNGARKDRKNQTPDLEVQKDYRTTAGCMCVHVTLTVTRREISRSSWSLGPDRGSYCTSIKIVGPTILHRRISSHRSLRVCITVTLLFWLVVIRILHPAYAETRGEERHHVNWFISRALDLSSMFSFLGFSYRLPVCFLNSRRSWLPKYSGRKTINCPVEVETESVSNPWTSWCRLSQLSKNTLHDTFFDFVVWVSQKDQNQPWS